MRVGTGRVERHFELVDGRPRTTAVVVDGKAVPVHPDGQELALVVDGRRRTDADLAPGDVEADQGGQRLAWTLRGHGLTVRASGARSRTASTSAPQAPARPATSAAAAAFRLSSRLTTSWKRGMTSGRAGPGRSVSSSTNRAATPAASAAWAGSAKRWTVHVPSR